MKNPPTYRETIFQLYKIGILPKPFTHEIVKMVGFRNILGHDYTKVDESIILNALGEKLDDFLQFISYINTWIKENY